MADTNAVRLWTQYAAFVDFSIGRARGAVTSMKAGTYSPENYWKDWAAFTGQAIELATVPYELVFRDVATPTVEQTVSLAAIAPPASPAALVYSIVQATTVAIGNDVLKYQTAGVPKTIAFTAEPTSDKTAIVVTIPTANLAVAAAGETYNATIHVQGVQSKPIVHLVLKITA